MIHYSCDRCKRELDPVDDLRYVVKLEIQAVLDSSCAGDPEDDRDHLLEVHEIMERMEDADEGMVSEDIYQRRAFDLCPECYRRFVANPLGREIASHMNFSPN